MSCDVPRPWSRFPSSARLCASLCNVDQDSNVNLVRAPPIQSRLDVVDSESIVVRALPRASWTRLATHSTCPRVMFGMCVEPAPVDRCVVSAARSAGPGRLVRCSSTLPPPGRPLAVSFECPPETRLGTCLRSARRNALARGLRRGHLSAGKPAHRARSRAQEPRLCCRCSMLAAATALLTPDQSEEDYVQAEARASASLLARR